MGCEKIGTKYGKFEEIGKNGYKDGNFKEIGCEKNLNKDRFFKEIEKNDFEKNGNTDGNLKEIGCELKGNKDGNGGGIENLVASG
ncbi:hypothetical protein LIER_07600 [Lithospermum erythrorhizon]|uniref:Uncharacterized protein n=1 Tax=Lithospermum erythrorhizon TaxID=34254 RepID=A0AAV3P931_LITER